MLLFSLLIVPPASRKLSAFKFSRRVVYGDRAASWQLIGTPVDLVGPGGWHLPATYRYRHLPFGQAADDNVDILVTDVASPRTDAREFPELYATSPWRSPEVPDPSWLQRATQHTDEAGRSWLEVEDWQGLYLVARVSPQGRCTSTGGQVRQAQLLSWRQRPWTRLAWPFSPQPDTDQRAVWVRMTVVNRSGGDPAQAPGDARRLWGEVLSAMGEQARAGF